MVWIFLVWIADKNYVDIIFFLHTNFKTVQLVPNANVFKLQFINIKNSV